MEMLDPVPFGTFVDVADDLLVVHLRLEFHPFATVAAIDGGAWFHIAEDRSGGGSGGRC